MRIFGLAKVRSGGVGTDRVNVRAVAWIRTTGVAMALALLAPSANAVVPVNVTVEFQSPPGCSDRETFAAGLRSRASRIAITEASEHAWHVAVRLSPKERGVHGELRLTDEKGESELRSVDGGDCANVVEALSLTAALAIEQVVVPAAEKAQPATAATAASNASSAGSAGQEIPKSSGGTEVSTAPESPKPDEVESVPDTEAKKLPRHAAPSWFGVSISGFVTERVSPRTSLGVSLAMIEGIKVTRDWRVEFGLGALYVPRDALQPGGELGVGYLAAQVQMCPITGSLGAGVSLGSCALFELAKLSVIDRNVELSYPSSRLTPSVGVLARTRINLASHLDLELHGALLSPLANRRYVAHRTEDEVGRTSPVAWQLGVGWLFGWD